MRKCFWVLFLLVIGCQSVPAKKESSFSIPSPEAAPIVIDNVSVFTKPPFKYNYSIIKNRCQQLYEDNKQERSISSEKKLISYLMDSLVPCWYGTPWDYNGITEVPGEGKIACGYLVTTTLRDAGMKINRFKMAQCVSQNLLYDLCKDHKRYSDKSLDYFVQDVEKTGYGLYIVGLDNHTGYLFNDGKDVWFIHSGLYPPKCALKEKAINSITLKNSRYRVFGRIMF